MKVRYLLKKMKNNSILLILGFLTCIILTFFVWHNYEPREIEKIDTIWQTKTDTFWKDTTIWKYKLVEKEKIVQKTDTFYKKDGKDTILVTENKIYKDTLCANNDSIILQSYISGINSNLDSIKADWRKSETVVTNTIEITKYIKEKKHFHIAPNFSIGYGLFNKNIDTYIGVGVGYEF